MAQKVKILKKLRKPLGDIIILHKCTKNHDHRLYGSGDMARDGCNYFSFWAIFSPFTPNSSKNQNLKKMKKRPEDIIILHKCTKNHNHMLYAPEKWRVTGAIVIFHFGLFFALLQPKKLKSKKMKKTSGDIIILHMCSKNYDQMMYGS